MEVCSTYIAYFVYHLRLAVKMAVPRGVGSFLFCFVYTPSFNVFNRGLLTLLIGIATFFKMPPSPTQTKSWFRPKGWFTEREETIAVTRILRDDPTKVRFAKTKPFASLTARNRETCITEKGFLSNAFGLQFAIMICGRCISRESPLSPEITLPLTCLIVA
jgi:hypothetical protein